MHPVHACRRPPRCALPQPCSSWHGRDNPSIHPGQPRSTLVNLVSSVAPAQRAPAVCMRIQQSSSFEALLMLSCCESCGFGMKSGSGSPHHCERPSYGSCLLVQHLAQQGDCFSWVTSCALLTRGRPSSKATGRQAPPVATTACDANAPLVVLAS